MALATLILVSITMALQLIGVIIITVDAWLSHRKLREAGGPRSSTLDAAARLLCTLGVKQAEEEGKCFLAVSRRTDPDLASATMDVAEGLLALDSLAEDQHYLDLILGKDKRAKVLRLVERPTDDTEAE